ncbi:CHRD domain-containing protein [Sedimenticola hydrogenitrophicus]|uniref:CHRD domain-containing protein n=1 Tax=Sedimenticola hydrogenitrophicus TaxID=2967975 RepID=UPI0023AF91D2|nr:CHRD domain-containing protein [Sedimenticola hydrogenitrophicus]
MNIQHTFRILVTGLLLSLPIPSFASILFQADLTADQEVPTPGDATASGSATLVLNDAMDRLEISIQLFGLDLDGLQTADIFDNVTAAHIHSAPAGTAGAVVFGFINPNNDTNSDLVIDAVAGTIFSAWDLAEGLNTTLAAQLPNLFATGLYINVHTPAFPAGAIRGQVERVAEPAVLSLFGLAFAVLAWVRRRT